MWQEELIDDFYLVIGRSDGSEALGHVVDIERKGGRRKASKLERERIRSRYYAAPREAKPIIRLGLDTWEAI
jgi:hypothetical protein